jgi:hypothetical protein
VVFIPDVGAFQKVCTGDDSLHSRPQFDKDVVPIDADNGPLPAAKSVHTMSFDGMFGVD